MDVVPAGFTAPAGTEGIQTADSAYCQGFGKNLYFIIVNPFAARNDHEKWADTPGFHDPSFIPIHGSFDVS